MRPHFRGTAERILTIFNLSLEHLDSALSALKSDSQNAVLGARGEAEGKVGKMSEEEFWQMANEEFACAGMPIHSKMTLEEYKKAVRQPETWMRENKMLY